MLERINYYDYATHYSYDIHGNVKTLWQDNPKFQGDMAVQRFKRLDYDYDLVSGKVNEVKYQAKQPDQFIHRYEYDADNRIIHVQTSKDGIFFDNDASYSYYLHGPLARVEVGNENVQGIDYAYTLQGWIKGVNSNSLNENLDMGIDGKNATVNSHKNFARDAFGYSLNYFDGDYTPIDLNKQQTANNFIANTNNLTNLVATNLYNGNIKSMVTTIRNLNTSNGNVIPQITGYNYDQLNRIKGMQAFVGLDTVNNIWVQSGNEYNHRYQNDFTYDANGNISTLQRYNQAGVLFDNFQYKYDELNLHKLSNRLYHVNDDVSLNDLMSDDIDDEGEFHPNPITINSVNNYSYDEIGNLKYDKAEGIESIEWTAYGKIKSITRINGFSKTVNGQTIYPSNLEFKYDATGNRIAKIEKPNDANGNSLEDENRWITTYYVRDATGNPMATYKLSQVPLSNPGLTSYKLIERPIYGSSRVGIDNTELELVGYTAPNDGITTHILGLKQYELVNHLGNVLTTITDKKIPVENNGQIDHYVADITSATDYYPFGSPMDGRNFSSDKYRFGFNGKENDNEVQGEGNSIDFGGRIYDSRLGRWLSLDPLHRKYPSLSPYHFCSNNPILFVDFDGNDFGIEIVGNTIIIKAVYYVGDKQTKDAMTEATNFINNQSDKYQFVTKDGKTYNIQFQLEVKELKNDEAASEEASKDNTANYARITGFPVKYGFTKNGVPQIILGMCEFGGDFIQLSDGTGASDDQKSKILSGMNCTFEEYMKSSILEEVLHSLGVSHEGMEKFSEFDLANFGENAIKGILRQASANDNSLKLKVKGSKGYSQSDKKLKDEDKVKSKTTSSEKGKMKGKVVPSKTSKS